MAKFKNDKGLTLIELLITIAVLAVVSAIALPVINNVVSSSNSNAAAQTQSDVTDFIAKYNAAGEVLLSTDGRTLQGYVDTDGDNTIDSNELVDTLSIDAKFAVQFPMTSSSDSVGGSYTSDGIVPPVITLASGGTTGGGTTGGNTTAPTFNNTMNVTEFGGPSCFNFNDNQKTLTSLCGYQAAMDLVATLQPGQAIELSFMVDGQLVSTNYTVQTADRRYGMYAQITVSEPMIVLASGDATQFYQIRY